jgi:POT family proton-dependent oligopeptide transporter
MVFMSAIAANRTAPQRTFLGHPLGLYVLFFTEMWERFSYYGMRALLILYMVNYFRWSQKDASTIYKVYTSFVYVTPIVGGYLADRYLGNRRAVIIGAILMAIGHFLMAFEEYAIFYSALIFLILGNGMFKPNMSTQVGRLYPTNDGRRDGAYTIFYMGINLGAFLSPLACGWLQENTVGSYHSGFTLAGIGMVTGLAIYLLGQPLIKEIDPNQTAPTSGNAVGPTQAAPDASRDGAPLTEAEAERAPSALGFLAAVAPAALAVLGVVLLAWAPLAWVLKTMDWTNAVMLGIGGVCLLLMAYVAKQVHGGVRDRVLAILTLGVFVMFFWAAYEQAGNVLNVWADKNTDRYLTQPAQTADFPPPAPEAAPVSTGEERRAATGLWERFSTLFRLKTRGDGESWGEWFRKSLNPVPTAWFQAINALAIFVIAPLFAWLWVALDKRNLQPSIPMKMVLGLLLMSASTALMIAAASRENQHSSVPFSSGQLPAGLALADGGKVSEMQKDGTLEPFHAGRLTFDAATKTLQLDGVLPDTERDRLIEATAPEAYRKKVEELKEASQKIGEEVRSVEVKLGEVPAGFDMRYAGLKKSVVDYRPNDHALVAGVKLADKEVKALLVAGGEPSFRTTAQELHVQSNRFRVSPWWLFWSYILATLGELCLSPVGLSMVSKLAPAKFATMLMGVWMLTSAFGNFAAGLGGEVWGTITPVAFFTFATAIVGGAALVLWVLVWLVTKMMHGVK